MLETITNVAEILLLVFGLMFITMGVGQYGWRTADWGGVVKMFYQRICMNTSEYKWYRLGVSSFVFGVIVRIVNLTIWPV
ncbi:hypothetical protein [uncultured Photobacterium sp.]|uniref:hypothetical protein n=1 Tax=uncultured Photobacterium sp. TaxID=173973 RepID=UPI00260A374A|nr:hypothetical protein [uncultured Photobacterium sp.]